MFGFMGLAFGKMGTLPKVGGISGSFSPSLDFSDARNSQYIALI